LPIQNRTALLHLDQPPDMGKPMPAGCSCGAGDGRAGRAGSAGREPPGPLSRTQNRHSPLSCDQPSSIRGASAHVSGHWPQERTKPSRSSAIAGHLRPDRRLAQRGLLLEDLAVQALERLKTRSPMSVRFFAAPRAEAFATNARFSIIFPRPSTESKMGWVSSAREGPRPPGFPSSARWMKECRPPGFAFHG